LELRIGKKKYVLRVEVEAVSRFVDDRLLSTGLSSSL
jgi:hypothetical protein